MALHTATIFAGTADGNLQSNDPTYLDAADGVGGAVITNDPGGATDLWVGQFLFGSFSVYEAFVSFDLTTLPAGAKIVTATLSTWLLTDNSAADFTCGARELAWGPTVVAADWQDRAELTALSGGLNLATLNSSGIGATGAYKAWASTAEMLVAVQANVGGTLQLVLFSGQHRAGSAPGGGEFLEFASADTAGTTNDPKLDIEYTPGAPGPFQRTTPRVWNVR